MAEQTKLKVFFHPDRPIQSTTDDRLGFGVIADNLATSILNAGAREGFVIGIEGPWGCGKSSILNLFCSKIENGNALSIVKFAPWIVGNRDNMVSSMMISLSSAVKEVESKSSGTKRTIKDGLTLADKMRKYGAQAGRTVSPLARFFAAVPGVPLAGELAQVADALSGLDEPLAVPLADLKDDLTSNLRELGHTFVVVVDDIDRLEPSETVEIMRLIRAVADFPNVIYVLCYDKKVLTSSLEAALSIENGSSFLQKIVQASFAVPRPEEFDLRRWLNEECQKLYEVVTGKALAENRAERLRAVCDSQGEEIVTPREINLVLNSLRLVFPPVADKVDFADLCWLHIIKVKNEDFYRWIEHYLNTFSVVFKGEGTVSDKSRKSIAETLLTFLELTDEDVHDFVSSRSLWRLKEYLPGIGTDVRKNKIKEIVLNRDISSEALTQLESECRLASPSHYRLYFAFAQPSGILHEVALSEIIGSANSGTPPIDEFRRLLIAKRAQGGTMYEVLLDRLKRYDFSTLSASSLEAIAHALVETIDDGLRSEPEPGFYGIKSVGRDAKDILAAILSNTSGKMRKDFIENLFHKGKSIGWLMADVIGDESFNHGLIGDRQNPDRQIFSADELRIITNILHTRAAGKDRNSIQHVPNPLSFFYRWQQTGGTQQLKAWMSKFSQSDAGFIKLMELLRGYAVSSSIGPYRPLNKRDLDNFSDAGAAEARISIIAKSSKNEDLKKAAIGLLTAISQGESH